MPDFGNRHGGESLDAIARTDQLLDVLADQGRLRPADRGEAELFALLEDWRDQVRTPSSRTLITEQEAAEAIRDGLAAAPKQTGGSRRGMALVSSLAAAVLAIGGFGAVVASAGPQDALYGLRSTLFGEPRSVRDDNVALAAQTEMAEVQKLIEQGDWEQAQAKLVQVSTSVQTVDDAGRKQELVDEWNRLNVKVENRDPNATVPAPVPAEITSTPGEVTAPPSETTTTSGATTTETSGTSVTTTPSESPATSPTSSPVVTTTPSAPPTTTATPGPTTTTGVVTTTQAPAATSSVPPTTTAAPVVTTTTTTTTAAPAAQSAQSSSAPAVSSVAEAPHVEASVSAPPSVAPAVPSVVTVPNVVIPNVPSVAPVAPVAPKVPAPAVPVPVIELPVPGLN